MALCLAAALAYTAYLIFAKLNPYGMNSDVACDIIFRRLSWEKKTLFPAGYVGPAESMSLRPVLLYWLFYAITHRFLLAFQLENICTLLLGLATIYYFLTKLKVARAAKFFSLFLMVTCLASGVQYVAFWTLNAYILYIITTFLTLALRISLREAESAKGSVRPIAVILLLAAVFGYGTIKMILFLYLPLVMLDVCRVLSRYFKRQTISRADRMLCTVSVASLCVNVLAYALFMFRHSDMILESGIYIADIGTWLSSNILTNRLSELVQCFGVTGGGALTSSRGILFLLSGIIAVMELVSIGWLTRNGAKRTKEFVGFWICATMAGVAYNALLGMTDTNVRYYAVVAISIHLLCGCAISEWMEKGEKLDLRPLAAAAAIVALFLGVRVVVEAKTYTGTPPLAQVAAYAEENGYQYAVGGFWNADVLTGLTDGRLEAWHSDPATPSSIVKMRPIHFLVDTNQFTQERLGEPGLLVLTDLEEQTIFEENSFVAELLNEHAEKVTEIDVYNLYAVTENPYTLIEKIKRDRTGGLPAADQTEKTDLPGNDGFILANNAALNENGELVSDGVTAGTILYGPYSETIPGVYDITLNYTAEAASGASEGIFDVALDTQRYAATAIPADQTSVTLEDVSIEAGHKFEARVIVPAGMEIRVQSIHYTRVG